MHSELNDGDLLQRMLAGDEEAFTVLYKRHQGGIYRFARQMTGDAGLAEEVTQEVFLTLMREGRSFNARRGSLRAWLYGIGRNCIRRCLDRERAYVGLENEEREENTADLLPDPCVPDDGLAGLSSRETVEQVRRAVLALPAAYREAVVLCELHEVGYAEAAQILGCPVGTVRSRIHRARELLAPRLRALRQAPTNSIAGARPCHRW
ncbi:MAG TPA: sigma-70 family RNA polymerase sigma factor [Terriglobales bacterium]|nr:sigma-70 family RNA polymerase sigma factor [Terriglobales bacterium]